MQLYQMVLIVTAIAAALVMVVVLAFRSLRQSRATPGRAAKAKETPRSATPPQTEAKTERRRKLVPASQMEKDQVEEQPSPSEAELQAVDAPAPADDQEPGASFATAVMAKLEEAFELYQAQDISLEAYGGLVAAEQASVERRISELRSGGSSQDALDDAEAAREAVEWCLQWAEDIAKGQTPADAEV